MAQTFQNSPSFSQPLKVLLNENGSVLKCLKAIIKLCFYFSVIHLQDEGGVEKTPLLPIEVLQQRLGNLGVSKSGWTPPSICFSGHSVSWSTALPFPVVLDTCPPCPQEWAPLGVVRRPINPCEASCYPCLCPWWFRQRAEFSVSQRLFIYTTMAA